MRAPLLCSCMIRTPFCFTPNTSGQAVIGRAAGGWNCVFRLASRRARTGLRLEREKCSCAPSLQQVAKHDGHSCDQTGPNSTVHVPMHRPQHHCRTGWLPSLLQRRPQKNSGTTSKLSRLWSRRGRPCLPASISVNGICPVNGWTCEAAERCFFCCRLERRTGSAELVHCRRNADPPIPAPEIRTGCEVIR
jgi:hypothetical protein